MGLTEKLKAINTETKYNSNGEITEIKDIDFDNKTPYTRGMVGMPDWLGTFDKSDLVVLAGYPSCGKTEFTFFVAKNNADFGIKTLYISLELTAESMCLRLARKKANISKSDWQMGKYTTQQKERANLEYGNTQNYENLTIISYETTPTIDMLEKTINKYHADGYGLFFIDNLGKIGGEENENTRFTNITNRLQTLKNKLNTCIFLLHHLSKPARQLEYTPGGPTSIRGSQKIVDNATLVFELFRNLDPDTPEEEKKDVDLILYKDTMDGATGTVKMEFDKGDYLVRNRNG